MEPPAPPATAVLLAAGAGTRLGHGAKALLRSAGVPLVSRLAAELRASGCAGVVVVLGAEADRVRREAPLPGCEVVVNAAWATGMAGSFQAGIAAVPSGHAVLVALVDQPGVDRRTAARLLAAHAPGRVAAAAYRQGGRLRRGHPVLFSAEPAREAAALATGDAGARAWLGEHPELVDLVDCSDLGDGRDIDTAADLVLLGPDTNEGGAMDLETFNRAEPAQAARFLAPCVPIESWQRGLVAGRPYASRQELLEAARRQAESWSDAEVDAALAHHPRIGQKAAGAGLSGAEAAHSRREQAAVGSDGHTAALWLQANREYEQRFGRIFLIRAAGRSQQEMLASLQERLRNDPATEARVRAGQLAEIALLRLQAQLEGPD